VSSSGVWGGLRTEIEFGAFYNFSFQYDIWWQQFLTILLNQLTKFSARDAGDFSDAADGQEMAPASKMRESPTR